MHEDFEFISVSSKASRRSQNPVPIVDLAADDSLPPHLPPLNQYGGGVTCLIRESTVRMLSILNIGNGNPNESSRVDNDLHRYTSSWFCSKSFIDGYGGVTFSIH